MTDNAGTDILIAPGSPPEAATTPAETGLLFDGDRAMIGPYLRWLADHMGLRDWYLWHGHATPAEVGHHDANACVVPVEGRKVATIYFAPDWQHADPEDFRQTCVHELLHLHTEGIRTPLRNAEAMIGKMAHTPIWHATTDAMEFAIDGIAYEWAKAMPLPADWLEAETDPEGA